MMSTWGAEPIDFVIAPIVATQFFKYSSGMKMFDIIIQHTDCLGYFEADVIAAIKYPGTVPLFAYVYCFPKEVWLLIVFSIVVLSLISSIDCKNRKYLKNIIKYLFNYSIALFSQSMENVVLLATPKAVLSVWLLTAFVLSNQFTASLMDFMIKAVPMVRIDTIEDLVKRKDMKIIVRDDESFTSFVRQNDTQLKRTLDSMLDTYEDTYDLIMAKLSKRFRDGSSANINKRELLIFNLIKLSQYEEKNELGYSTKLLDTLHLSEKNNYFEPYFMFYNNKSEIWIKENVNKMLVMLFFQFNLK